MELKAIKLKKGKEVSMARKHPWVFSGAIQQMPKDIQDGDLVDVWSYDMKYLGTGHYQGGGSIAVRVISFTKRTIDQSFWNDIVLNAKVFRQSLGIPSSQTDTYRLLHGEGDGIPGLIIDIYHHIAVIQCHSIGTHMAAEMIGQALISIFAGELDTIYLRCKETLPENYGSKVSDLFLVGQCEETIVLENSIKFKINVVTGQKTGFFLDQRENRDLVGKFAQDKSVLNCFCYTGGFSLYALQASANNVDSVDISQIADDRMDKKIQLKNLLGKRRTIWGNVMSYLGSEYSSLYDIVIVDPPAFAKSLHKRHNAVQAYKRLNSLAMKKVKNGGYLFTFSCSQVVGTQLFYDTIVAAGIEAGKNVRVVKSLSQGPDHPINLFHPEGHYLKGLLLYIE